MSDTSAELLKTVREMKALLELLAEPAIALRDAKLRNELRRIVGSGKKKQQAVLLMDGKRSRKAIIAEAPIMKSALSELVIQLSEADLVIGDSKTPQLAISIPPNFFDHHDHTD